VLTISKQGQGTSTVRVDGSPVNSGATVEAGKTIAIHVEPATGQVPTATLNGQSVSLTEDDGAYEGTATMPAANATLVINSGTSGSEPDDN
jgi:ribosomal 50S subunit-recycling heat shock protein